MNSKDAVVFNIEFTPSAPGKNWSDERKEKWAKNRRFYSCNTEPGEIDVVDYVADDEKVDVRTRIFCASMQPTASEWT